MNVVNTAASRLIVMTRYPNPGESKTRLIPALGAEGAADLHRRLAEQTAAEARKFTRRCRIDLEIRFTGGDEPEMRDWLRGDYSLRAQGDGDLGARLSRAFSESFAEGSMCVVAIGTDCPELGAEHLVAAFDALREHELVIGPAADGGYYLIGLSRPFPEIFQDIPWGSGEVFDRTVRIARANNRHPALLPVLSDIDRPEDLERARHFGIGTERGA